ncbi:alpha-1,2-fucosyltransferase [Bradyrhizobium sp. 24]|nr:alpha-1,2-fucosyltransferase [Bradyrhizobium sp. 37]MCK1378013.1 alpha-1,2-fucosyltransferase [Bradyrhizobium sp. 24]MCK1769323.1 alpha-1,2-fucosyltransferase [Bradyrhizobium sp. 134]
MSLRFAIPRVEGKGAGLGNELIVWAKAFIGAQALGLRLLHPAWGLNRRNYSAYFETSRADWITHHVIRAALPTFEFEESDYRASADYDLHAAVVAFARRHDLRRRGAYVVSFSGLWGGFRALRDARDFLRAELLGTKCTIRNLYELNRRFSSDVLRVGFHIRRGDFSVPTEDYAGRFNIAIPIEWYVAVATQLVRALGTRVSILIVSDATLEELRPLTERFPCVTTSDMPFRDVSDLLALSACDFVLCSISSFSAWATFLSDTRYGWFAPQLTCRDGYASIWGHEPFQSSQRGETTRSQEAVSKAPQLAIRPKGIPISLDGSLPSELISDLESTLRLKSASSDLVQYGVVRQSCRV